MAENSFIPNSYQTPNAYCDRLMYLMTPTEWKVLSYAVRRIFGFHKRQDHISLSQFVHGTLSSSGEALDHGTGLSKPTVIACLDNLIRYRLIVKLADNGPKNDGDLYALQLNYEEVDYAGLIERANSRAAADTQRTAAGRNISEQKRRSLPLPEGTEVVNGIDRQVVNGIDRGWSMGLTGGGQSDRPLVVNGIDTQNTVRKQEENKGKGIPHQAGKQESVTEEDLLTWDAILGELRFSVKPQTFKAYIEPAKLLSVNGVWTIAVPAVEWWQQIQTSVKRIYKKLTGETTDFVFIQDDE